MTIREPFLAAVLLSMILSLTGSISTAVSGALADRVGRKRVLYAAGWLMFAGNSWRPGLGCTAAFLFAALCFLAGSLLIRFVDGVA